MAKKTKKLNLFWIVGLCAFVALMCSGVSWILGLVNIGSALVGTLKSVATIILSVVSLLCGWTWLSSSNMNKKLKLVLQVLFLVFAVLSIMGTI
jgi:hypothetical protein